MNNYKAAKQILRLLDNRMMLMEVYNTLFWETTTCEPIADEIYKNVQAIEREVHVIWKRSGKDDIATYLIGKAAQDTVTACERLVIWERAALVVLGTGYAKLAMDGAIKLSQDDVDAITAEIENIQSYQLDT